MTRYFRFLLVAFHMSLESGQTTSYCLLATWIIAFYFYYFGRFGVAFSVLLVKSCAVEPFCAIYLLADYMIIPFMDFQMKFIVKISKFIVAIIALFRFFSFMQFLVFLIFFITIINNTTPLFKTY